MPKINIWEHKVVQKYTYKSTCGLKQWATKVSRQLDMDREVCSSAEPWTCWCCGHCREIVIKKCGGLVLPTGESYVDCDLAEGQTTLV